LPLSRGLNDTVGGSLDAAAELASVFSLDDRLGPTF
jgi:hypothetical protein